VCKHVLLSQKLKIQSLGSLFLHCFPSPLFQAMYTKYVDRSMLRIGCLRQLAAHWQHMHSTNIPKYWEPKDFKGFMRFAYKSCFLQAALPCVLRFEKNISCSQTKWMISPEKQTLHWPHTSTFWSPEGHSGNCCTSFLPTVL